MVRLAAVFFVLLALARIISTYHVFNESADEAHFAAGLQWIADGQYDYEYQHPPLARILLAVGPYLSGIRPEHDPNIWHEANRELAQGGHYWRTLTLARLGVLPFFILACWILWRWAGELYGSASALAAVALFTMLPPILAHAGLATLDMAAASTIFCACYCWWRFLREPTFYRATLLGISVGAAVLSKFSSLLFVPVVCLVLLAEFACRARANQATAKTVVRQRWIPFALAVFVAGVLISTIYRGALHAFYAGIGQVIAHNASGHESWLLGQYGTQGWWYFFPVVLAVKTPLGFLALAILGIPGARLAGLCSLAILLVCLPAHINLGVRHILVIYPFLAMTAGSGFIWAIRFYEGSHYSGSR